MTTRSSFAFAALVATTVALAGCASAPVSDPPADNPPATEVATPFTGVVTRDASGETASNLARTRGVLEFVDGCLRLADGTIPVFASDDVTWDGTTLGYRGKQYVVGNTILLGGGERATDAQAESVPSGCGEGRIWGVARTVDTPIADPSTTPVVTRDPDPDGYSMAAIIQDELVLHNGCLRFANGTVPIFPSTDVSWDGFALNYRGDDYGVGDSISLGGGSLPSLAGMELFPPECGDGEAWIVG
ncbi:MAG TPA: hypothetical protein VGP24_15000 [Glaciihabitans sp.]|jgi:hypothetical protein|nr:hypothetical protein [Glaciihabitans sp.]